MGNTTTSSKRAFGMKMLKHAKMSNGRQSEKAISIASPKPTNVAPPKPTVTGMKMLTYEEMRKHAHTENPQCACHNIEETLAKVPEDQQSQFVRVFPRSQPRYANYPTGASMFREELDLDMTVPRNSAEQPRPSLDSMIMAPQTTEKYTRARGGGDEHKRVSSQACIPQVTTVVSSFFTRALQAVQHRSKTSSLPVVEPPTEKKTLSEPADTFVPAGLSMPQPPPPAVVPLVRSNAVRYRNHPRPQLSPRENSCLARLPGGEADSYYFPEAPRNQPARSPKSPGSPIPKPQQRKLPTVKGTSYSHVECYAIPLRVSPPSLPHSDRKTDKPRPLPSLVDMPGLPPPIQCDGYLRWPNLGTRKTPPEPTLAPSPDYQTYWRSLPDDVSDGIPEAIPALRRFSLDEFSLQEVIPARTRFSLLSVSDEDDYYHDEDADNKYHWNRQPSSNPSAHKPPVMRCASFRTSSESSLPARIPIPEHYTRNNNRDLDGYLADDDMNSSAEPDSDDDDESIDQSLFADFDGTFTDTPSLTRETSPSNSSKSASVKKRVANKANRTSIAHDVGHEDGECDSGWDADEEGRDRRVPSAKKYWDLTQTWTSNRFC